jgi:uncharacterized protein YdhG (YjbR/CyaY superfamily)
MADIPKIKFHSVDAYIAAFPENVKKSLEKVRMTIRQAVPEAEEQISYNMPAFRFHGVLSYYAAHKEHIGFYPADARVIEVFRNDLKGFETSKGTIRIPFEKPIPVDLIKKIVKYRAQENLEKEAARRKKKK